MRTHYGLGRVNACGTKRSPFHVWREGDEFNCPGCWAALPKYGHDPKATDKGPMGPPTIEEHERRLWEGRDPGDVLLELLDEVEELEESPAGERLRRFAEHLSAEFCEDDDVHEECLDVEAVRVRVTCNHCAEPTRSHPREGCPYRFPSDEPRRTT